VPRASRLLLGAAALTAAGVGYAVAESRAYTLRRCEVPVLPAGAGRLRVLHLSDLHLTPRQRGRVEWLRRLAVLQPDLVVVTGDFLAHPEAVPTALDALDPLLRVPGLFVLGSNDYFAPTFPQPWTYLAGPSEHDPRRRPLPTDDLVAGLTAAGWTDLDNARSALSVRGLDLDVRGVDDPHIERDDYAAVSGPFSPTASLRLGVTHAPYRRVLDAMTADGAGLVLAGHTHGGQLCVPFWGALVTNCDLPTAQARGLSRIAPPATPDAPGLGGPDGRGAYLHVSAGVGTSPYTPVRFACRPEATLLTLVPAR